MTYFHMATCHTIISAKRFHFRVRDGIGWFTLAMFTKQTGLAVVAAVIGSDKCDKFAILLTYSRFIESTVWKSVMSYIVLKFISVVIRQPKRIGCYMVKPHGQLVHVSFTHYCASTPCLSTS